MDAEHFCVHPKRKRADSFLNLLSKAALSSGHCPLFLDFGDADDCLDGLIGGDEVHARKPSG